MGRDSSIASARPTFPVFLLPSFKLPFHRRQTDSSISSAASAASFSASLSDSSQSSAATTPSGSPPSLSYFPKSDIHSSTHQPTARRLSRTQPDTLRCSTCAADLAFGAQIVSKGFTGRYGRAYLVSPPTEGNATAGSDLINVRVGKPESRQLVTGWHTVADISCAVCGAKLGWKYVDAKEQSQKYKVGKFILETERVVGYRSWEDVEVDVVEVDPAIARRRRKASPDPVAVEEVVFDSDDEDECEDIFAGTWDPEVVAKRRSKKVTTRKKHAE